MVDGSTLIIAPRSIALARARIPCDLALLHALCMSARLSLSRGCPPWCISRLWSAVLLMRCVDGSVWSTCLPHQ